MHRKGWVNRKCVIAAACEQGPQFVTERITLLIAHVELGCLSFSCLSLGSPGCGCAEVTPAPSALAFSCANPAAVPKPHCKLDGVSEGRARPWAVFWGLCGGATIPTQGICEVSYKLSARGAAGSDPTLSWDHVPSCVPAKTNSPLPS